VGTSEGQDEQEVEMKQIIARIASALCVVGLVFGASATERGQVDLAQNWCAPVNLGPVVNTSFQENYPQVAPNGLALYFESNRPGGFGGFDLYVSHRPTPSDPWGPGQNLGPIINSSGDERTPHWTPDGTTMYFSSTRAGGSGKLDFYVTSREDPSDDFGWGPLENIGEPINTVLDDVGGEFDLNAGWQIKWFYFTRESLVPTPGPPVQFNYDIMISKVQAHGHTERFKDPEFASFNDPLYRDTQPAIRADGLELVFSSTRPPSPNSNPDIFAVTRASLHDEWSAPVHLGIAINSPVRDENGSYDVGDTTGNTLLLMSPRPGGQGGTDLYSSTRMCP
jgi:WD40 repeat protein